jgi:tight adherence protein C
LVSGAGAGPLLHSAGAGVAAACLGALAGYALPDAWLGAVLARRQRAIDRELLYFLDLLALAAQAGLPLDAALEHVARELPGILSAAFAQVRAERGLGQWNEHALSGLAERLGHRDVRAVVEALVRAGRFGSRTAPLLRQMASSIRARRNLAAREHANRVGTAIVLPVAVFILPAVVLILGFPAVATVAGVLGPG